jgi:hypothetical protein
LIAQSRACAASGEGNITNRQRLEIAVSLLVEIK